MVLHLEHILAVWAGGLCSWGFLVWYLPNGAYLDWLVFLVGVVDKGARTITMRRFECILFWVGDVRDFAVSGKVCFGVPFAAFPFVCGVRGGRLVGGLIPFLGFW